MTRMKRLFGLFYVAVGIALLDPSVGSAMCVNPHPQFKGNWTNIDPTPRNTLARAELEFVCEDFEVVGDSRRPDPPRTSGYYVRLYWADESGETFYLGEVVAQYDQEKAVLKAIFMDLNPQNPQFNWLFIRVQFGWDRGGLIPDSLVGEVQKTFFFPSISNFLMIRESE